MDHIIPRYSRHALLKMIGEEGQAKIEKSRVFIAGLGALGSLIAILLARAGVCFLRVVDPDSPELHNLHRQILYDESDLARGLSKAEIAKQRLVEANSAVEVEAIATAIGPDNVHELISGVDLVVDALDNMKARYFINDAIVRRGIPYVFGGAVEAAGNVMTIIPGRTPCLRCLWPDPAAVEDHPKASSVGILSSAATTVASIEVTETLKVLVGSLDNILPGLLVMDFWRNQFQIAKVKPDPSCMCNRSASLPEGEPI
ncbi:MAG TPA: HesA/MoeB/ThiF family protein [Desulfomonilaceae bacterium]|nr:HesA/MoeB/ThiF family protein [Desulfomonilaceae bacterium]